MFTDYKSNLLQGIEDLKANGYKSEFFLKDAYLTNISSKKQYLRGDILQVQNKRFQEDNPEDSSILFLFECNDGTKGYASSSFGTNADEALIDFALAIHKKYLKINVEQDNT